MTHPTATWGLIAPGAPTNTADFTALTCPAPANRDFQLWKMFPRMNREEDATGEAENFFKCLQEIIDLILCDTDTFDEILDPDKAPEINVDLMLCDLGNPFDFELSLIDKRRLISVLVPLYKQKGTEVGVINAIRFFVGVTVTLDIFNKSVGWILGDSELGVDTDLSPSAQADLYTFNVDSPVALTVEQRTRITKLVALMKGPHEHLGAIIEPSTDVLDHWELGESELGVDSDLH